MTGPNYDVLRLAADSPDLAELLKYNDQAESVRRQKRAMAEWWLQAGESKMGQRFARAWADEVREKARGPKSGPQAGVAGYGTRIPTRTPRGRKGR